MAITSYKAGTESSERAGCGHKVALIETREEFQLTYRSMALLTPKTHSQLDQEMFESETELDLFVLNYLILCSQLVLFNHCFPNYYCL